MQFLVTLVQLSFLLRVIWQNVEGLAKKPTSGTLDTIWEVTGTKLPVLPVPPGHPVSKQNADVCPLLLLHFQLLPPVFMILLTAVGHMWARLPYTTLACESHQS